MNPIIVEAILVVVLLGVVEFLVGSAVYLVWLRRRRPRG